MSQIKRIPVVDIFAGPGGLGEGFARFPYERPDLPHFQIKASVEKDPQAHKTLLLRSFRRQFPESKVPGEYYDFLRDTEEPLDKRLGKLYAAHQEKHEIASREAICAELGNDRFDENVRVTLERAVGDSSHWVLLGGPPCQAYSLAGRSRNKGNSEYVPTRDNRQFLYREYLKVIAEHLPSVFVMENVKGLLSATLKNKKIFSQIIEDLQAPWKTLDITRRKPRGLQTTYRLFSLLFEEPHDGSDLSDFVIQMENHGIPQKRHRLIIMGIRDDLNVDKLPKTLVKPKKKIEVSQVLSDLPRLRSGLSKGMDNESTWKSTIKSMAKAEWYKGLEKGRTGLRHHLQESMKGIGGFEFGRGGEWIQGDVKSAYLPSWFHDGRIAGVLNHQTRGHIASDLHRYLFAACYADVNDASPVLKDFPEQLRPNHKNIKEALGGSLFADRFRVQCKNRPSTTVTCHISKDGHYYIHPDPTQCRSLTVREAARLQTFPDNYFFCGPRTSQYVQVGNAVPPLLAHQIAEVVHAIFSEAGVS